MRVGILAEKLGMSRYYDKNSINQPVTLLKVSNCKVISIQSKEKNGYNSVTLSHGKSKNPSKPFKVFLKKNNLTAFSRSREFRLDSTEGFKVGHEINVSNFVEGQYVDVSSNSIGKGFAGGIKRHNFAGNRATHGVSISHRSHGSTGQCQDPGKVFKGKKMAGRLGNKKITTQNLLVLKVDTENNLLIVKGSVPGHKGCMVRVVDAIKKEQDIKTPIEAIHNNEDQKNIKENTVSENSSESLNQTKETGSTENKDEVIDTKVNSATEQSIESQSTEKTSEQGGDSALKQGETSKEESKG